MKMTALIDLQFDRAIRWIMVNWSILDATRRPRPPGHIAEKMRRQKPAIDRWFADQRRLAEARAPRPAPKEPEASILHFITMAEYGTPRGPTRAEICAGLSLTPNAVEKHLQRLRRAGRVSYSQKGGWVRT